MIAALFVETDGVYFGLPNVDPWDEKRDARTYAGPWSVVAHPPCARWCRLAGLVEARWGYRRGEDGGDFQFSIDTVRAFGGVIEHPAFSDAWYAHGLPVPNRFGGWQFDIFGGASCYVEQGRYGHPAKKATWLYAVAPTLPAFRWGWNPDQHSEALISWCGNHVASTERRRRLKPREASRTPDEFRDVLISIAESCYAR